LTISLRQINVWNDIARSAADSDYQKTV